MPKGLRIGKQKKYTVERLQELRREADLAGDVASRVAITAKIVEQGGTVPTGEIPVDESKMSRLERLRQDALDVNDIATADKLAEMIAEAQVKENGIVPETEPDVGDIQRGQQESIDRMMKESSDKLAASVATSGQPHTPIDGGMDVHVPNTDPNYKGSVAAFVPPESAIATQKVNDGTASVNAQAMIDREGYRIDEIPARFGAKLDVTDVKRYGKMLTEV